MATTIFSNLVQPETLHQLAQAAKPSSYADIATLLLVSLGSTTYLLRGTVWDKPDPYRHLWFERPQLKNGAESSLKKKTRNIAQKLKDTGKNLVIFWGSQSGTAEGFANSLARECHLRYGLEVMAADLSDYDAETIALISDSKMAIFILSTFGEGDPSDNTAAFWDWINKSSNVSLSSLKYMAFGLGNSNYKYYNRVVDVVSEALNQRGAKLLMPVGRADDAEGGTAEDFMTWKDSLFSFFRRDLGLEEKEPVFEPTLAVVEDESLQPIDLHHGEPAQPQQSARNAVYSPIKAVKIQNARELFNTPDRNCIHMDLDLNNLPELNYKTGDHLAVWPNNVNGEVERLINVLGLSEKREIPLSIKSLDSTVKIRVPSPTTLTALFQYYLEICAPISRSTVLGLAQFAPSLEAKTFVINLGRDKDTYLACLASTHLNLGRLLELAVASSDSKTWSIPLAYILETIPPTQPRYYSISSSSVVSPRCPSITALVSNTPLQDPSDVPIPGLTSNYLLSLTQPGAPHRYNLRYNLDGPQNALEGGKLYACVRRSKFKLPALPTNPIIMVAAGTGLAPFRAFIQERARLASMGRPSGEMILFFGCRDSESDYIYREELEASSKQLEGKLEIVTAFSRVGEKVYVQDRVRERSEKVCRLINEGANFYVCGRASMSREVGAVIVQDVSIRNGWDEKEARFWSEALKKKGKWQEDVWG